MQGFATVACAPIYLRLRESPRLRFCLARGGRVTERSACFGKLYRRQRIETRMRPKEVVIIALALDYSVRFPQAEEYMLD
jgi:hypothetical protein